MTVRACYLTWAASVVRTGNWAAATDLWGKDAYGRTWPSASHQKSRRAHERHRNDDAPVATRRRDVDGEALVGCKALHEGDTRREGRPRL